MPNLAVLLWELWLLLWDWKVVEGLKRVLVCSELHLTVSLWLLHCRETGWGGGRCLNKPWRQDGLEIIQARANCGMDQSNSVSGKKWLHSGSLVKVKPVGFAHTLDVESERSSQCWLKLLDLTWESAVAVAWVGQDWKEKICEKKLDQFWKWSLR